MSSMNRQFMFLAVLSLLLAISPQVSGQAKWRFYAPPDKSFSVELPRMPKHTRQDLNYEKTGLFEGNTHGDVYDFSPNDSGTIGVIGVYYVPQEKSDKQFDAESDGLMLVVGGDDKEFLKQESVTVNGMHGREYIYKKGSIRGRVLIVNSGKRRFLLQYHTEEGALPEFVARIFDSFRPAH